MIEGCAPADALVNPRSSCLRMAMMQCNIPYIQNYPPQLKRTWNQGDDEACQVFTFSTTKKIATDCSCDRQKLLSSDRNPAYLVSSNCSEDTNQLCYSSCINKINQPSFYENSSNL